ncbi:uncharacterized protein [Henckelia pumila]|uniref:uncharacterized protein n=1 Tax=Henckelia pumila TaxID=405737 RepID=UPI003C6E2C18
MELEPAEFKRGSDLIVAEECVQSLETIFQFMQLNDADWVRCATFMFWDDARVWWKWDKSTVNLTTLNWNGFKDVFYGKYFTVSTRTILSREFSELCQGILTIAEYVRKFERGRYFVPMISNDLAEELKHIMEGLDASICGAATYRAVVDEAMLSEKDKNDIIKESQEKRTGYPGRDQQGPSQKRPYQAPTQGRPQQK